MSEFIRQHRGRVVDLPGDNVLAEFVISRNSTFTYKSEALKVQQVAEELAVRHMVEGSIARSVDLIRVAVQVIDAFKERHWWADRNDREFKAMFALRDYMSMKNP
jgi:adenylate cyclase